MTDAYIYQAALLCEDCGAETRLKLKKAGKAPEDTDDEGSYDSDEYPKGPYADGGGESDAPEHCDQCGVFLENDLTEEGYDYVKDLIAQHFRSGRGDKKVLKEWAEFYDIPFEKGDDEPSENPTSETGWRNYGPGKFNAIVDSYVHALSLDGGNEELGDVEDFGNYVLMTFKPGELLEEVNRVAAEERDELTEEECDELEPVVGVILDTDNQGFVGVSYYSDEKLLKEEWGKIEEEYAEFVQDDMEE